MDLYTLMSIINMNETCVSFSALILHQRRESKTRICSIESSANINEVAGAELVLLHFGVFESR